jgi:hypothetical protein
MCAAKRGEISIKYPLVIHRSSGRKLEDFIWISLVPVIHNRVADLLTLSDRTGWAIYPVNLYDDVGGLIQVYQELTMTGRCESMFLDEDHSELVYEERPRAWAPQDQPRKPRDPTKDSDTKCQWGSSFYFVTPSGRS